MTTRFDIQPIGRFVGQSAAVKRPKVWPIPCCFNSRTVLRCAVYESSLNFCLLFLFRQSIRRCLGDLNPKQNIPTCFSRVLRLFLLNLTLKLLSHTLVGNSILLLWWPPPIPFGWLRYQILLPTDLRGGSLKRVWYFWEARRHYGWSSW